MRAHDRAIDRRVGAGIDRSLRSPEKVPFFDDELVAGSVSWCTVHPGKGIGDRQWTCESIPSGVTICAASKTRASAARPPSADRDDVLANDTDIRPAGA
jgi:hypothetical protein